MARQQLTIRDLILLCPTTSGPRHYGKSQEAQSRSPKLAFNRQRIVDHRPWSDPREASDITGREPHHKRKLGVVPVVEVAINEAGTLQRFIPSCKTLIGV